ncbi:hypothetical protein Tco_1402850 [Tanacetum coccineum]
MGDEHLNTIPETESDEVIKSSVEDLVPMPSESKGISDDICDVPFCDNDHLDAEFGFIDSLLSRDISITSLKIDFLPEEFAEEGAIDIEIEDEILREKLLNVNLLIDKIEALNLTPSIPFVLEYPSSSPIPVVDSDFLIEEVDTFLVSKDSIPPGIESDFDSEGDIIFLNDLLNDDPIPEYERFTFDIEPDTAVINNFDELNEDECFDPGGGEIFFPKMLKMTIPSHLSFRLFSRFLPTLRILLYISPPRVKTPFLTPLNTMFLCLIFLTHQPTLCLVFDPLLPFSSENEDKVFKHGILISPFLSHRDKITFDFYGGNTPYLEVNGSLLFHLFHP